MKPEFDPRSRLKIAILCTVIPPVAIFLLPSPTPPVGAARAWLGLVVATVELVAECAATYWLLQIARRTKGWIQAAAALWLVIAFCLAAIGLLMWPLLFGNALHPGARLFGGH